MSTGNIQQTPKKISTSSSTANISCCRLCKSVGDVSCSKNIYAKGNRALLAAAEDVYGRPLRQDKLLPHLLCRPCERRLKNFMSFKTVISESQSSFETVKRCTEISPSVQRTSAKSARESERRSRRGLNFDCSEPTRSSSGKEVNNFMFDSVSLYLSLVTFWQSRILQGRFRVARIFLKVTNFFQNELPLNASAIVENVGENNVQHQVNWYIHFFICCSLAHISF